MECPQFKLRHYRNLSDYKPEIQKVIDETKAYLRTIQSEADVESIDFSYITEELLAAKRKQKDVSNNEVSVADGYCYKGHHYYKRNGNHNWTNGNPSDGCDEPRHKCKGGWNWYVHESVINGEIYGYNCPRGSDGYNSAAWEGRRRDSASVPTA